MLKPIAFAAAVAVTLVGCSSANSTSAVKGDDDHFGPTSAECLAAQHAVASDASAQSFNGVGQTSWLDANSCLVEVMFPSGQAMLQFVDARIAAGKDPTVEKVGATPVNLILDVVGPIVAQAASAADDANAPAARAWTMDQAQALQHQFEGLGSVASGDGITNAEAGIALEIMFTTAQDLRAYVAGQVAAGVDPAPFHGTVGGKALYIPMLLQVVGVITAEPTASVSN